MILYQMSKPSPMHLEYDPKYLKCFQCEKTIMEYILLPTGDKTTLNIKCSCGAEYPYKIDGSIRIKTDGLNLSYERTNSMKESNKEGIMTVEVIDE